jgi:hypothetical protein
MEGTSLGGELVLVSACLTVSPLITGGQAHTRTLISPSVSAMNCAVRKIVLEGEGHIWVDVRLLFGGLQGCLEDVLDPVLIF